MSKKPKILTIDDNALVHKIVQHSLDDRYIIFSAHNGEDGLKIAEDERPDIILLDVEMPELNGYDVCKSLKEKENTANIPVVFLSSLSNLDSRMAGYEAGGVDFLIKPFEAPELLAKLKILTSFIHTSASLNQQIETATHTAFSAMRGSSELGLAIQYIESSYGAKSLEALADKFLTVTSNLGLSCTLMFIEINERLFYSSCGIEVSPLEKEVIATIYDKGDRFTDFGSRTQVNYSKVALLVKNMPLNDMDTYGRYKDFLPTMLGATDAKAKSLETEQALYSQSLQLSSSFSAVRSTLTEVGACLEKNQADVVDLLQSMLAELEDRIPRMGLEDDQEAYIVNRVDTTIAAAQVIIDSSTNTSHAFKSVSRLLQHLAEKQQSLVDHLSQENEENEENEKSQNSNTEDIVLF